MARALLGHVTTSNEHALAYEVARLRRRVAELQNEIEQLRQPSTEAMDLELHAMAEQSEPALA